jgi:hypothetical protein
MNCRHCKKELEYNLVDLGFAPPSNAYLTRAELTNQEKYYPLKVKVCDKCWLVQTEDYAQADEFFNKEYAYFSSTSTSWLEHAKTYCEKMIDMLQLNTKSLVVELASNDGYLLKNFVASGIPCFGIEPTDSTADASEKIGVPVLREFFGEDLGSRLAKEGKQADLIVGNNVYAHVPDINDFTRGIKQLLNENGTVTLEFPHLLKLIEHNQFDTIYHEHFSYLSLGVVSKIFESCGLRVFDVEQLSTHGGSLRVFGCHSDDQRETTADYRKLIEDEVHHGLESLETYVDFQKRVEKIKIDFLHFLAQQKIKGKKVIAYGAAAKGNTLLNYCEIKHSSDYIEYVVDRAAAKQNKFMPGSRIPILGEEMIMETKPDVIIIFPWNIKDEICAQLRYAKEWNASFVIAIPFVQVIN